MTTDLQQIAETVVVGDDGSAHAAVAMRWARDDAQRRGVPLTVLRAWSITTAPRPASFEPGYVPSEDEFAAAVREEITQRVAALFGAEPGVTVHPVAVHESPREALAAASQVAALVVVAARGRGLAKALLGSTSEHLVRHAAGPVVVIPTTG